MKHPRTTVLAAIVLAGTVAAVPPAGADAVADFYKDRTLTVVIGFGAGGGADTFGRLLARHIGDHVPGNPSVIAQNMPGAGGFKALNHVYHAAPKDGTHIVLTASAHATAPSMGNPNARWDMFQLQWLGNLTKDSSACVASDRSGVKDIREGAEREIIFGASGMSAPSAIQPISLANIFGYKLKVIAGYGGTAETRMAMEKGEMDATCSFWASLALGPQKAEIESGKLVPIVQLGSEKHPVFGDAPLVYDLARDDKERQVMRFLYGPTEISRSFAAPPGVPAERVAALREAFWAAANSTALRSEAERQGLIIDPMDWKETEAAFRAALDVPQEIIDRAKEVIRPQ